MRFLSSHVLTSGFSDGRYDVELSLPAQPPQAETPGELPVATMLRVGSIELGPGRPIIARDIDDKPLRAALWATDDDVSGAVAAWGALADRFPTTGLWPLLLHGLYDGSGRPWSKGELEPVPEAAVDALDVREVLEEAWHGWLVPINNPWRPARVRWHPSDPGSRDWRRRSRVPAPCSSPSRTVMHESGW